jgi:hypothetical protein
MTYEEFLFSQLYMVHTKSEEEYDLVFGTIVQHFLIFQKSSYNVMTRGLYECIQDYLVAEVKN